MNRSVLRGVLLIAIAVAVIAALVLLPGKKQAKHHPPNDDPWVLVNYNPDDPYGTYLGNGFISTRIMGDGVGSQNGQPLPCYMAGFYDDEKLIPIPTWSDLRFYDGKTRFKIDKEADYKQTLDMRTGIFTTYATWRAGRKTLKGKIEVIVSRAMPNVGLVRADLMPSHDGLVTARYVIGNLSLYLDSTAGPWQCVSTLNSVPIGASLFTTKTRDRLLGMASLFCHGRIGETQSEFKPEKVAVVRVSSGEGLRLCHIVSIAAAGNATAATDAQQALCTALGARDRTLKSLNYLAARDSIDGFVQDHKAAWAKLWESNIEIDGPRKDQQVIHSCEFYILQSVREGSKWSIPPMGLSNNAFGGHVFWDADIWMFPALILQRPELAKSIVEYRYQTLPGAIANAKAAGMPGAQYAWESGFTGNEDTPEGLVYRHERHINGDVALAQWQYFLATNDLNWLKTRGYPVIRATADWWAAKATWVPVKRRYEILQVVPPDENAELINNSAYTNAIAQMNLDIAIRAARLVGQKASGKWAEVSSKLYIPFDAKNRRFIAFDGHGLGMFGPRYKAKQADTELLAYPLQYQIPGQSMTDIYRNTFDHYALKMYSGGPAMTSSAYSVITARLGDCPRAYSEFRASYKPFLRGPFNYFNEKPSKHIDNLCFLTGAAGPVQAALFGFGGARMDYFGSPEIGFSPCLPKQWKSLKMTNVQWRGKTFDVVVTKGNKAKLIEKP